MPLTFSSYFAGGPTPKFSLYHIWKAYQVIDTQGPVGRKALADALHSLTSPGAANLKIP